MLYWIGVPLIIILSTVFGFVMAKRKESVGTGKVYGFLFFLLLVVVFVSVAMWATQ